MPYALEAHLLALEERDMGGAGLQLVDVVITHRELGIQNALRLFHREAHGHNLGNGGRAALLVGILLDQHLAGIGVHHKIRGAQSRGRGGLGPAGGQRKGRRRKQEGGEDAHKPFVQAAAPVLF